MNDINFLLRILQKLKDNNIEVWLFGGWAEELHQAIKPKAHGDIDLLYPEKNFYKLEKFMNDNSDIQEIQGKRFSHKRAFLFENIMVELFLVYKDDDQYMINFFGKHEYKWPDNTFSKPIVYNEVKINIASKKALSEYRKSREVIEKVRNESLKKTKIIS